MVKTWLEDNWFARLDRMYAPERLLEAERNITNRSLLPYNIDEFPKLYDTLFPKKDKNLSLRPYYVPGIDYFESCFNKLSKRSGYRSGCKSTYETFIETIYPRYFNRLIEAIPLQVDSRRRAAYNLLKDNQQYKDVRSSETVYRQTTNKYTRDPKKQKQIEEDYIALSHDVKFTTDNGERLTTSEQYVWIDPVDPGESTKDLPDREKEFFLYNMKYLGISDSDLAKLRDKLSKLPNEEFVNISEDSSTYIVEILKEILGSYLSDIKDSAIQKGCKEIPRKGIDVEEAKTTLFDFRKEEICINSDYLGKTSKACRDYFKCDAFVKGLPSLGDSASVITERWLCSGRSAMHFTALCKQLKIDKNLFNDILPEDVYSELIAHPVYLRTDSGFKKPDDEFRDDRVVDINMFEEYVNKSGLPTMAVRAADCTSSLFNSVLGGTLVLDKDNNLLLKRRKAGLITPQQAKAAWRNYYKADVLYLYDHPTETYSDGTPAKTYIPIQVKYVPTDMYTKLPRASKSVQMGHMNANARLLKALVDPKSVGMTEQDRNELMAQVASLLLYGDYFLVTNSWDIWCYLPLSEDTFRRGYNLTETSGGKEYTEKFKISFGNSENMGAADIKLRVANRLKSNEDGRIVLELIPRSAR